MDVFRNQAGDLAEGLLNLLSHSFFELTHPGFIGSLAVFLALYLQVYSFTLGIIFFLFIVSVATMGIKLTVCWQVDLHLLQSRHIDKGSRMNQILHGQALKSGDELDTESIEVASLRSDLPWVLFSLYQAGASNSNIVTDGHGKGINPIFTTYIQRLEQVSQIVKQAFQHSFQAVKSSMVDLSSKSSP